MTGLVDGYAVCSTSGKSGRWVDLTDAEDGMEDNLHYGSVESEGVLTKRGQGISSL